MASSVGQSLSRLRAARCFWYTPPVEAARRQYAGRAYACNDGSGRRGLEGACGNTWVTRSTKPELKVEVCSNCHPFYTGQQKMIDTEGRVERFIRRWGLQEKYAEQTDKAEQSEEAKQ